MILDVGKPRFRLDLEVKRPGTDPNADPIVGLADFDGLARWQFPTGKDLAGGDQDIVIPQKFKTVLNQKLTPVRCRDLPPLALKLQATQGVAGGVGA